MQSVCYTQAHHSDREGCMSDTQYASSPINIRLLAWTLAATGGFVDTAGFLGLDGLFCAHVTGNLVLAGTRLAAFDASDALVRLMVLPVFAGATALTMLFIRRRTRRGHPVLPACLLFEALALTVFTAVCLWMIPRAGDPIDDTTQMITGSIGVIAMAIQNTLMRECLPHLAPTTVMTGNITGGVSDILRMLWGENSPAIQRRAKRIGVALGGFMAGSLCAAIAMRTIGFVCLLAPICAITFAAICELQASFMIRSSAAGAS